MEPEKGSERERKKIEYNLNENIEAAPAEASAATRSVIGGACDNEGKCFIKKSV